jgi:hypothetical protein
MVSNRDIRGSIYYLEDVGIGALKVFFNMGLNCFSNESIQDCAASGDRKDECCRKDEKEF